MIHFILESSRLMTSQLECVSESRLSKRVVTFPFIDGKWSGIMKPEITDVILTVKPLLREQI